MHKDNVTIRIADVEHALDLLEFEMQSVKMKSPWWNTSTEYQWNYIMFSTIRTYLQKMRESHAYH